MQANEKALLDAIEAARIAAERAAARAKVSLDGLAKLKGKLLVPVEGHIRKLFGNRRQGQVRWKGIIIDGKNRLQNPPTIMMIVSVSVYLRARLNPSAIWL